MKETKARQVELFDTSLRDGLQQPDLEISVPNAVLLLAAHGGVRRALRRDRICRRQPVCRRSHRRARLRSIPARMKLALFGRTRGRGAKVEDWPDVQFIVRHKRRVPVAVIVVKSRLLDVERSLEATPEENLLMTLGDHRVSASATASKSSSISSTPWTRSAAAAKTAIPCGADFAKRSLDHFHQLIEQCVRQKVSRIVVCDTNGGASPEEVAQRHLQALMRDFPGARIRISRPHRSRPWHRQHARRDSGRRRAGAGHADRNRRALRQREPDHGRRRHAASRRSGVCSARIAAGPHQPGALGLCGLRA